MQVYTINFHGHQTGDGYWTTGIFTDRAKADRVCAWLNASLTLSGQLREKETATWDVGLRGYKSPRSEAVKTMGEALGDEGGYKVVTEEVFDTAADWMTLHSTDIEAGLRDHDPSHPLTKEAEQLRLF